MTKFNELKDVALFSRKDKNGNEYFSVVVETEDGVKHSGLAFYNKFSKESEKQPKYKSIKKKIEVASVAPTHVALSVQAEDDVDF